MFETLIEARKIVEESSLYSPIERRVMFAALDALIGIYTPPTEGKVDASLNRIADGDELAHAVAASAIEYLFWCDIEHVTDPGKEFLLPVAEQKLRRVVARYQEAMET